jgi:diketogulonate reductase-like aldo/keto reductase
MAELVASGGENCQTNQILYNLTRRGPEYDLIPGSGSIACRSWPIARSSKAACWRIPSLPPWLGSGVTPAQLALAWLLARDGVLPIPKAGSVAHVRDNRAALDLTLSDAELHRLDRLFPPPHGPEPLAML